MRFKYSPVRVSIAGSFVFPIHATLIFTGLPPLRLFPTPEQRRRQTESHPLRDSAPSPSSPQPGSPATRPPEVVPASAGRGLRRRRSIQTLLLRLRARSSANCESPPLPREIPSR